MDETHFITERIIASAFKVSNELGVGFLEKVYQRALVIELRKQGLRVQMEVPLKVYYQGEVVGDYYADLIVNDFVLLELKAVKKFENIHTAQVINYLKATGYKIGLLINFGNTKVDIKRLVY